MDAVAAFFERFNARKLDEMADLFGSGYTYAEPMFPEPRDAAGHVAHMRQILETYPDRQMRVRRCVPGPNGEMVEAEWSGTRAGSGRCRPQVRPDQPDAPVLRTTCLTVT